MNLDIWAGISKLDRTAAAISPKRKNKTAGSINTEKISERIAQNSCGFLGITVVVPATRGLLGD
jgi:hypothetical protein